METAKKETINFYSLEHARMSDFFKHYCETAEVQTGIDQFMSISDFIMGKRRDQDYSGLGDDIGDYLRETFIPDVSKCSKRLDCSKKDIGDAFLQLVKEGKLELFTKDYYPLLSTPEQYICDTLEPLPRAVEMVVLESNNNYMKKFFREETGGKYVVGKCSFFRSEYDPNNLGSKQLHHEAILFTEKQTEKLASDNEILVTPISDQLLRKARDRSPKPGRVRMVVDGYFLNGEDELCKLTREDEGRIISSGESFLIPDVALALPKIEPAFQRIAVYRRAEVSNPTPVVVLYPRMRNQMEEYIARLTRGSNKKVNVFS